MKPGLSLTELVIVVAVVAILGAVAFIVIDPAHRINQTQDNTRYQAVNDLMDAFLRATVNNNNTYPAGVAADGMGHMIATSSDTCTLTCSYVVDACTDFSELVEQGYLKDLPKDPDGTVNYGQIGRAHV